MKALGMDAKSEEIRKLINDIDSDGDHNPSPKKATRVALLQGGARPFEAPTESERGGWRRLGPLTRVLRAGSKPPI